MNKQERDRLVQEATAAHMALLPLRFIPPQWDKPGMSYIKRIEERDAAWEALHAFDLAHPNVREDG